MAPFWVPKYSLSNLPLGLDDLALSFRASGFSGAFFEYSSKMESLQVQGFRDSSEDTSLEGHFSKRQKACSEYVPVVRKLEIK